MLSHSKVNEVEPKSIEAVKEIATDAAVELLQRRKEDQVV